MFDSLFSGVIFLKFLFLGIIFGLIYEICKLTKRITKNNIFIVNTVKFVYFSVLGIFFCSFVLRLCSGQVLFYTIFAVIVGIILEQISIGFFFTKFYDMVYNVFAKLISKAKTTKLGNKILR